MAGCRKVAIHQRGNTQKRGLDSSESGTVVDQPMSHTHFQTFIDAFTAVDRRFRLLDGDDVLCPPSEDYGYLSTPKNAVTFAAMGVDGVHFAILKRDGQVRDDSPVVHVSPMDSDDLIVVADSLLLFLAIGCNVPTEKMQEVLEEELTGRRQLVAFLSAHFDRHRLLRQERLLSLTARYGHLIERKNDFDRPGSLGS